MKVKSIKTQGGIIDLLVKTYIVALALAHRSIDRRASSWAGKFALVLISTSRSVESKNAADTLNDEIMRSEIGK